MRSVYFIHMKNIHKNRLDNKKSIFSLFFIISLLLHVILGALLQTQQILPKHQDIPEPTEVTLHERNNWLELDQKPKTKAVPPPKEATHIADSNAEVKKEAAPKGDDSRDKAEQIKQNLQIQQDAQQKPAITQKSINQPAAPAEPSAHLQAEAQGDYPLIPVPEKTVGQIPVNLPSLSKLTNLSARTLARLDQENQKPRVKDRPEIQLKDDEVWLNLRQDDKLISFFRRFSDRIEAVWNYPVEASSQGVEGTLLIKIIINKKGELVDAFPLESSGSEILDYEAITAIYRAAPFGELPSYYKHDQLKIYAHFQYSLNRRMLYGNPYN